jgi:mRNA interferase MazF
MGKPLVGEVVVLPFPHTDLSPGKRRPALVVATCTGPDVILCQITSQPHTDRAAIPIIASDFAHGRLSQDCFARANRLFTIDSALILYTVGRLKAEKTNHILDALRKLFSPIPI